MGPPIRAPAKAAPAAFPVLSSAGAWVKGSQPDQVTGHRDRGHEGHGAFFVIAFEEEDEEEDEGWSS